MKRQKADNGPDCRPRSHWPQHLASSPRYPFAASQPRRHWKASQPRVYANSTGWQMAIDARSGETS